MSKSAPKSLDNALEAAFAAGVAFGVGYPTLEAIPNGFSREAYLRWRESWTGKPHGPGSTVYPIVQRGSEAGCYQ